MANYHRMLAGELYCADDPELSALNRAAEEIIHELNSLPPSEGEKRDLLIKKLLGKCGKNCVIKSDFRCDYGFNIAVGENFFANYNCVFLDVCKITIGDDVMLGPNVQIYTATHPLDAVTRSHRLEYGKPVEIGNRVWIGGGAIINPGVTIGNDVIVGAGAVVTKSFPDHVIIAGNPAKIIRPVTPEDENYWQTKAREYFLAIKNPQ